MLCLSVAFPFHPCAPYHVLAHNTVVPLVWFHSVILQAFHVTECVSFVHEKSLKFQTQELKGTDSE